MIQQHEEILATVEETARTLNDRITLLSSKDGARAFLDEQKAKAQAFLAEQPIENMAAKHADVPDYVSMQDVIAIQMEYIDTHPDKVIEKEIDRLIHEEAQLRFQYPAAFKQDGGKL